MGNVQERPLFAILREDQVTVELHLFGRTVAIVHTGPSAKEDAATRVVWWNDHFEREWMGVKEVTAAIMQNFTEALQQCGVGDVVIRWAINAVRDHVKA